uniref:Uncharacterized protein n=1 Tax=Monopterus albus TaxID=43700 RepID=A0A3Q3IP01_MONAL
MKLFLLFCLLKDVMLLLRTFAAQRNANKPAATVRGKFTTNKMQCTWGARDVRDTVKLSVKCENPEAQCEYTGKPESCPGYLSDPRGFWKQVARALKRLKDKVCTDERAVVKAGMCKRAPRYAHFKLSSVMLSQFRDRETSTPPPPSSITADPTPCTGRADHRKRAEEYCSSSWASVCAFLFSVVQRDC